MVKLSNWACNSSLRLFRFKCSSYRLTAVGPWESYLAFQCLSFPLYVIGIIEHLNYFIKFINEKCSEQCLAITIVTVVIGIVTIIPQVENSSPLSPSLYLTPLNNTALKASLSPDPWFRGHQWLENKSLYILCQHAELWSVLLCLQLVLSILLDQMSLELIWPPGDQQGPVSLQLCALLWWSLEVQHLTLLVGMLGF